MSHSLEQGDHNDELQTGREKTGSSEGSKEDLDLVRRALKGEDQAYRELVGKYRNGLYYHILKLVRDKSVVDDMVQETLLKAFDNLPSFNQQYAFSTWLYRIATNHSIDYLRKRKLQTYSLDEPYDGREGETQMQVSDESFATDRDVMSEQRNRIIADAIESLPEKYREVIRLRHMEEKSYQEISEVLDLPLGTIKAHLFRGRELLYKYLKDKIGSF